MTSDPFPHSPTSNELATTLCLCVSLAISGTPGVSGSTVPARDKPTRISYLVLLTLVLPPSDPMMAAASDLNNSSNLITLLI